MKHSILGIIAVLACASIPWATPVSDHGRLTVSGGQLVDAHGNPPQLRGMSFFWDIWSDGSTYYTQGAVNTLANDWKVGVVRAAIGAYDVSRAESMIDWAIAAGIYIIIDNHSHDAHLETSTAKNFFSTISAYVKNKGYPSNVIYEIYNEPIYANGYDASSGYTTWSTVKTYAEQVLASIRANDPYGIVVVGTPYWSQGVLDAVANPITSYSNVVYTFHFYASDDSHYSLRGTLKNAWCQGLPIFVTEWGVSEADGNGTFDQSMTNEWMGILESLKLSWTNWSVTAKGETSSALYGGNGDGTYWSLSPSGTYVKNLTVKLANGQSVSGVSSSSVVCATSSSSSRTGGGSLEGGLIQAENYLEVSGLTEVSSSKAQEGVYMGDFSAGDWARYYVDVTTPGLYTLWVRVASSTDGNVLNYSTGTSSGQIDIPSTNGFTTWKDVKGPIQMESGRVTLEFSFTGVDNSLGMDAFVFFVPDSTDSVDFNLNALPVIPAEQPMPRLQWRTMSGVLQVHVPAEEGVLSVLSLDGRRLAELPSGGGEWVRVPVSAVKGGLLVLEWRGLGGTTHAVAYLAKHAMEM